MRYSSSLLTLASIAATVVADTDPFSIVNLHQGGDLSNFAVHVDSGILKLSIANDTNYEIITDDGKLKFTDGSYAVTLGDGSFISGTEPAAATGWSVKEGVVYYKGSSSFYGTKGTGNGSNATYTLSTSQGSDGKEVKFDAASHTSDVLYNFPSTSNSTNGTTANTTATNNTSSTGTSSSTNATASGNSTSTSTSHSKNGAARNLIPYGGLLAVAALLL